MTIQSIQSVVVIGAGNAAWYIAHRLIAAHINILQIANRTAESASALAKSINSSFEIDFNKLDTSADAYLFCISDDAIAEVAKNHIFKNKFLIHTAGSVPMNIFSGYTNNFGVLYPFQTLKKGVEILSGKVPICIEASNETTKELLIDLGKKISNKPILLNSHQRQIVHLAGVFANNFVNHLFGHAFSLLEKEEIDKTIIFPLIDETVRKAFSNNPFDIQTGPAIRNNTKILEKHMKLISHNESLQSIYRTLSENILHVHSEKS
jgi:predicted short-subunit dehydrogenase-like oxidoreductase (DUF2520 family)